MVIEKHSTRPPKGRVALKPVHHDQRSWFTET